MLGIIIFVLDPNITGLVFVGVFVFEVISNGPYLLVLKLVKLVVQLGSENKGTYSSSPESCMKSSSSDIVKGVLAVLT